MRNDKLAEIKFDKVFFLRKANLAVILFVFLGNFISGQNTILRGKISDSAQVALPFVNIMIKGADSISFGTITDIDGIFEFKNVKPQNYIVNIVCMGFQQYKDTAQLSNKDTVTLNIALKITSKSLAEVVILGKLIEQYADKNIYYITSKDTKTASAAFDILKILPKTRVDFVNNTITTTNGKAVKILINGMNASSNDLLAMKPEDIVKIEFFDIVPTRFASEDIGAVINVITRSAIQGGEFFINSKSAVTTGFSDDNLMLKFVKNNNQISLNYDFSYRDYKKRVITNEYKYKFNNVNYNRLEQGVNSPFYYQVHNFDLKFINQKSENYIFCVDLMNSFLDGKLTQKQNIFLNDVNLNQTNTFNDASQELNPSLNIYLFKKFKYQQEFSLNIVPTYYNDVYSTKLVQKKESETLFYTNSNLKSQKYSVISEALYTKTFKSFKCNTGFVYSNNLAFQRNSFLNSSENNSSTLTNYYFYAEIVGKIKKASYNVGLGYNSSMFKSKELNINYNTQTPRPRITLQYDLTDFSNIKLTSSISPQSPALSDLSNNLYYKDSIMAQSGNPNLKPYNNISNSIEYNIAKQKCEFSLSLYYNYADRPFLPIIENKNNLYIETNENFKWEKDLFPQIYLKLNPLKKQWLQFAFSYTLMYFENKYSSVNTLLSHSVNGNISANYKDFSLDVIYYNGGKSLNGEYILRNESALMSELKYKYKKTTFAIGIIQPFFKSIFYESELAKTSTLIRHGTSNIYDNGNMFYLKFVYHFSFGKKADDTDIKLNNKDSDSGVFKAK